jgi:hypothetical protein
MLVIIYHQPAEVLVAVDAGADATVTTTLVFAESSGFPGILPSKKSPATMVTG